MVTCDQLAPGWRVYGPVGAARYSHGPFVVRRVVNGGEVIRLHFENGPVRYLDVRPMMLVYAERP